MAKYFFGSAGPVGRHIGWERDKTLDVEIVGVVKDAKVATVRQAVRRYVYAPYMQETEIGQITFYVQARGDAAALGRSLRQAATRIDPNLPILSQLFELSARDPMAFAGAVMILIAVGLAAGYLPARRATSIHRTLALHYE